MINLTDLKQKIDEVITFSQGIENPKTDRLVEQWYESKKHFIEKWGGMTYEVPNITTSMGEQEQEERMRCFCRFTIDATSRFYVQRFILEQGVEAFWDNKTKVDFTTKDDRVIKAGTKMSKCLKHFIEDKRVLNEVQIEYSKYLQDSKFSGTLVMSVHPLDFLSSSENNHNWRSCHALDGEYRCGNLSYMLDKHTIICFVKSTKEEKLPNFPFEWNSKKWRVLLHMREDANLVMAGKQYPFENAELLEILFDKTIKEIYNVNWNDKWVKPPKELICQMMEDSLGSLHFNDCLLSSSYSRPYIRYEMSQILSPVKQEDKMFIGDAVECLDCGKGMISLSSCMRCEECGGYTYCDCCGEAEFPGDLYELNGELMCERCYDENVMYCDCCDIAFDSRIEDMTWNAEDNCYRCEGCQTIFDEEKAMAEEDEEVCDLL